MKILMIIAGTICMALGVAGIFLPLLPTTPFLLLAAAAYFRGSARMYAWLMNHKYLGAYIRNFRENRTVPLRVKILSIALLWLAMGYSILFLSLQPWLRITLAAIAIGVTCRILSYKTG
ncbi:MAG: YbaN family protein [Tannerella sp.]|jgi:uncharacterized membrane protein YbaN (DUF454 family)|nr:YbaN family protein [Tannerella sp.]